jgi:hypothetical protein
MDLLCADDLERNNSHHGHCDPCDLFCGGE